MQTLLNKRQRKPKGQYKTENTEKLATQETKKTATTKTTTNETKRRKIINQKHNTICVGHHYTQTNRNNVNKT